MAYQDLNGLSGILNNKIDAPGYIKARMNNDMYVVEAYRNARFIGMPVPHIDHKQ